MTPIHLYLTSLLRQLVTAYQRRPKANLCSSANLSTASAMSTSSSDGPDPPDSSLLITQQDVDSINLALKHERRAPSDAIFIKMTYIDDVQYVERVPDTWDIHNKIFTRHRKSKILSFAPATIIVLRMLY